MEKNAKIGTFFYKERKRTQRSERSFIKNGKECKDRNVLLKRTDAQPWLLKILQILQILKILYSKYFESSLSHKDKPHILNLGDVCSSLVAHLGEVAATRVRIPTSCQYCTYCIVKTWDGEQTLLN